LKGKLERLIRDIFVFLKNNLYKFFIPPFNTATHDETNPLLAEDDLNDSHLPGYLSRGQGEMASKSDDVVRTNEVGAVVSGSHSDEHAPHHGTNATEGVERVELAHALQELEGKKKAWYAYLLTREFWAVLVLGYVSILGELEDRQTDSFPDKSLLSASLGPTLSLRSSQELEQTFQLSKPSSTISSLLSSIQLTPSTATVSRNTSSSSLSTAGNILSCPSLMSKETTLPYWPIVTPPSSLLSCSTFGPSSASSSSHSSFSAFVTSGPRFSAF
jgi:hypothetical protein